MTQFDSHGLGARLFPVPAGNLEDGLSLHPGWRAMAELCRDAINDKIGDAWRALMTNLPASSPLRKGDLPVASLFYFEPRPTELNTLFARAPFLCVYPTGPARVEHHSLSSMRKVQTWDVDLILGMVDAAAERALRPLLIAALDAATMALYLGGDSGHLAGARQFVGQFASVEVTSSETGVMTAAGGDGTQGYLGGSLKIETTERTVRTQAAAPYNGADANYVKPGQQTGESPITAEVSVNFDNQTPDPP